MYVLCETVSKVKSCHKNMMKQLEKLLLNIKLLRDLAQGCPWNRQQTFASLKHFTIEESYEVAAAIKDNDMAGLRDELGDLLFHVVLYSEMAAEQGDFNFHDVVAQLNQKLERRNPHVFSDRKVDNAEQAKELWQQIKQQEAATKQSLAQTDQLPNYLLDQVSVSLPALTRATKLQKTAAQVGFDFPDNGQALDKIAEELQEVRAALGEPDERDHITEEMGDLMFCCINLARHCGIDAELALDKTNDKFVRRFNYIEASLQKQHKRLHEVSLEELDALWNEAKLIPPDNDRV